MRERSGRVNESGSRNHNSKKKEIGWWRHVQSYMQILQAGAGRANCPGDKHGDSVQVSYSSILFVCQFVGDGKMRKEV